VVVCEHIEQGVKSGRIFSPTEKRGFEEKRSTMLKMATGVELENFKKPEPQNFQAKSQIGNYQRV
jgi:hypothetical protein